MQSKTHHANHPGSGSAEPSPRCRLSRYNLLPKPVKAIYLLVPLIAVTMFTLHWFSIPVFGHVLAGTIYYYL
ncbi:MAG: hypothetical protein PHT28_02525, partial [Dehalococcoidales bacterium]|nr:hypothetical protein [Dehalococcoidales bacterium]